MTTTELCPNPSHSAKSTVDEKRIQPTHFASYFPMQWNTLWGNPSSIYMPPPPLQWKLFKWWCCFVAVMKQEKKDGGWDADDGEDVAKGHRDRGAAERCLIQLCDEFSAFSTVYANAIVFRFCIILFRIFQRYARHCRPPHPPYARCSAHKTSFIAVSPTVVFMVMAGCNCNSSSI